MKQKVFYILLVLGLVLSACAPQATQAPATQAPPTQVPATSVPNTVVVTATPQCAQEVKIAIIGAMSGTNAALGDWMVKGVTLAVETEKCCRRCSGLPGQVGCL